MAISAFTGPIVVFGQSPTPYDYNPELGTSLFFGGIGLLDPRAPFSYTQGQTFGAQTCGWQITSDLTTVYGPPTTLSTTKLSTAAHITANTAMTLISSTVAGAAVGVTAVRQDTNQNVTGLIELDPLAMSSTANITNGSNIITVTAMGTGSGNNPIGITIGMVLKDSTTAANIPTGTTITGFGTGNGGIGSYTMSANATATATGDTVTGLYTGGLPVQPLGQSGTIRLYHPGMMISRAVSITSTTSQVSGVVFTVNGLDCFGYPMTETITTSGTSATTTSGKKAFKYILSVTPSATDGTGNYSVGTLDLFGFPFRSDQFQTGMPAPADIAIMMNNALITSSTGYTAAVLTNPNTATAGDVRGTYNVQTPSNGTLRLGIVQSPSNAALQGNSVAGTIGLFGIPQFASF